MLGLIPRPLRRMARRYIEGRGFLPPSAGPATLDTVMSRRRDVSVEAVIDVGASNGHWTARTMRYFPRARYLLIEAQKNVHGAALKKFKDAHSNVEYELCAAGNREGEIHFDASDPLGGAAATTPFPINDIVFPMRTVDDLVRTYDLSGPFLIKLDTHGFEVPILEGARETLKHSSMLIIEAYNFTLCPGCLRFYELCSYLEQLGFRCADVFDVMVRPRDQAFWQMDMVFLPSTHRVFQSNAYSS